MYFLQWAVSLGWDRTSVRTLVYANCCPFLISNFWSLHCRVVWYLALSSLGPGSGHTAWRQPGGTRPGLAWRAETAESWEQFPVFLQIPLAGPPQFGIFFPPADPQPGGGEGKLSSRARASGYSEIDEASTSLSLPPPNLGELRTLVWCRRNPNPLLWFASCSVWITLSHCSECSEKMS